MRILDKVNAEIELLSSMRDLTRTRGFRNIYNDQLKYLRAFKQFIEETDAIDVDNGETLNEISENVMRDNFPEDE